MLNNLNFLQQIELLKKQYTQIPKNKWASLIPHLKPKRIKKGDYFFKIGEVSEDIGFILNGLFKVFGYSLNGDEKILDFRFTSQTIASVSSYLFSEPSFFSAQALVNSYIIFIPYKKLIELGETDVNWERLLRVGTENSIARKERREYELLFLTPEERYIKFTKDYLKYLDSIPQYSIASYLGITPVSLSRIRARLK